MIRPSRLPETRAFFSPILRLSTQAGEKSSVRGFHAAMVAGALRRDAGGKLPADSLRNGARGRRMRAREGARPAISDEKTGKELLMSIEENKAVVGRW
jgi:hypothetical protein